VFTNLTNLVSVSFNGSSGDVEAWYSDGTMAHNSNSLILE
jgi:hypothetical protein